MSVLLVLAGAAAAGLPLGALLLRQRARLRQVDARMADVAEAHDRRARARLSFIGSMAHELRTPLAAIMGYQELLAEGIYGRFDERVTEAITRIGRAAEQLGHLIDGTLELAVESGPTELEPETVATAALVRDTVDEFTLLATESGLGFTSDVPDTLPVLTTDARRLQRALYLMLYAAVRATSDGTLRVEADGRHGLRVVVAGAAMPAEALPVNTPGGGTLHGHDGVLSLRLATARATARLLGGELAVEPDGEGRSRLVLTVPALPAG
jgi:signal transduction histidine kinase